jgi:hypothetical protein
MALTRKQFIQAALASIGGASFAAACGDDTSGEGGEGGTSSTTGQTGGPVTTTGSQSTGPGGSTSSGSSGGCMVSIGTNHGHTLTIPDADVMAAQDKTYMMGGGTHMHTVDVTAAQFGMLGSGGMVTITSGVTNDHTHMVTISGC